MLLSIPKPKGRLEVVCGSMFSGKTEELIRRLNRAQFKKQRVMCFKPELDTRHALNTVVSHNQKLIPCTPVKNANDLLKYDNDYDLIGIDESQFFDMNLVAVCQKLLQQNKSVVACGLDMDFLGNPFGPMPFLMAIADDVLKLHAICTICGEPAYISYRKILKKAKQKQIVLGDQNNYEARCRNCIDYKLNIFKSAQK